MKTTLKVAAIVAALFAVNACSEDDGITSVPVEGTIVRNLHAPQEGGEGQGEVSGPFVKFSFATGTQTDSDTEWDIAFRGTDIAVNGGEKTGTADEPERNGNAAVALVESTIFAEVTSTEGLMFKKDSSGAFAIPPGIGRGWYNYNFQSHTVGPIKGKVWVFRTRDGNQHVKVEFISFYEHAPASPNNEDHKAYYYTFIYDFLDEDGTL